MPPGPIATLAIALFFLAVGSLIVYLCNKVRLYKKEKDRKNPPSPHYHSSDTLRFTDEVMEKIKLLICLRANINAVRDDKVYIYALDMERAMRHVLKELYLHIQGCERDGACKVALNLDHLDEMIERYESEAKSQTP